MLYYRKVFKTCFVLPGDCCLDPFCKLRVPLRFLLTFMQLLWQSSIPSFQILVNWSLRGWYWIFVKGIAEMTRYVKCEGETCWNVELCTVTVSSVFKGAQPRPVNGLFSSIRVSWKFINLFWIDTVIVWVFLFGQGCLILIFYFWVYSPNWEQLPVSSNSFMTLICLWDALICSVSWLGISSSTC